MGGTIGKVGFVASGDSLALQPQGPGFQRRIVPAGGRRAGCAPFKATRAVRQKPGLAPLATANPNPKLCPGGLDLEFGGWGMGPRHATHWGPSGFTASLAPHQTTASALRLVSRVSISSGRMRDACLVV